MINLTRITHIMPYSACSAGRLLEADSRVADVMVGPGSPEHPYDHRTGLNERGGK
jgi:hypothetical protein